MRIGIRSLTLAFIWSASATGESVLRESLGSISAEVELSQFHTIPLKVFLNVPRRGPNADMRLTFSPTKEEDAQRAFNWIRIIISDVFMEYPSLWDGIYLRDIVLVSRLKRRGRPIRGSTASNLRSASGEDLWQRIFIDISDNSDAAKLKHTLLHELGHALGNSWNQGNQFGDKWLAIVQNKHSVDLANNDPQGNTYAYRTPEEARQLLRVRSVYTRFGARSDNDASIISAVGFASWQEDSAEMIAESLTKGGLESLRRFCSRRHVASRKMKLIRDMFNRYGARGLGAQITETVLASTRREGTRETGNKIMLVQLGDPTLSDDTACDYLRAYYLREGAKTVNVVQLSRTPDNRFGPDSSLILTFDTLMVVVGPIQELDGVAVHSGTKTGEDLIEDLNRLLKISRFRPQAYPKYAVLVESIQFVGALDRSAKDFSSDFIRAMARTPIRRRVNTRTVIVDDEATCVTKEGKVVPRMASVDPPDMMTTDSTERRAAKQIRQSWNLLNPFTLRSTEGISSSPSTYCLSL